MQQIPQGTLLDCELYSNKGRRGIPSIIKKTKKAKPLIFVFDIIFYKGKFLGQKPLKERKKILKTLRFKPPFYLLKFEKLKNLRKSLENSLKKGYEGIILKNLNSPYLVSEQSQIATIHWRKLKG